MKSRKTTRITDFKPMQARLAELTHDNARLLDLLRRMYDTYTDMTTANFSIGADRFIRAEVREYLDRLELEAKP